MIKQNWTIIFQAGIKAKSLIFFYAIAMLMGTITHVQIVLSNGWFNHGTSPKFVNYFWDSLTVLDLVAALLLFIRVRLGLLLVLLIIVSDVLVNTLYHFDELFMNYSGSISSWISTYWQIVGQWIFCIIVLLTFRYLWKTLHMVRVRN